jgi:hypothetical protein
MTDAATVKSEQEQTAAPSQMERLKLYLAALPESAKKLLATEIERGRLHGNEIPGGDLILSVLRPTIRTQSPAPSAAARGNEVARLLFKPVEPFLIDERLETKVKGRVTRASLENIWTWLSRDLVPAETKALEAKVTSAETAEEPDIAQREVMTYIRAIRPNIDKAIDDAVHTEAGRKRLWSRLGDEFVLEDLKDVLKIWSDASNVGQIVARTPNIIKNLADEGLANARGLFEQVAGGRPDLLPILLALFQNRLVNRAQLARLAVAAVDSDDPVKIIAHPYRAAIDLVICDIERAAFRTAAALKAGRTDRVVAAVKDFHDSVRVLRTDVNMAGDGPWQKRVAKCRAELSRLLSSEIEPIPGTMRRLLRTRQRDDYAAQPITEDVVQEVEAKLDILTVARNCAAEIALNEVTLRIFTEIQGYLDPTLTTLLEAIKASPDVDRALKISQIEAAVRFSARIFGASYAQLLQKAADVAIRTDKVAVR